MSLSKPAILAALSNQPQVSATFEGSYNDFSESGTYRIVIYAQDNDGRLSYPTEIEVEVVVQDEAGSELYLPLVIR